MFRRTLPVILALSLMPFGEAANAVLERQFAQTVKPFISKYCTACHSGETPAAQFDLRTYSTMDTVVRDHARWMLVLERLTAKEMPPKPLPQPEPEARQQVIDWIKAVR